MMMVIDSNHNGGLELYIAKTNVRGVRTCSVVLSFFQLLACIVMTTGLVLRDLACKFNEFDILLLLMFTKVFFFCEVFL